jgi:NADP-dependent 3-hydroxy acid dehydrogenase YdfG
MFDSQLLDGEAVLITGASAGIGRETARLAAAAGADVSLAARREERLEELADELEREHDCTALALPTDVRDSAAVSDLVSTTVEELGGLDVVVINAALGVGSAVEDLSDEEYHLMMDVNTDGMFFTAREAIPHVRESAGHLVFVGSFAAEYPRPGNPVYAASKAWARSFAHSLEAQVGGDDVAISVVNPSEVRTEFGIQAERGPAKERLEPGEATEPEAVAEAILFAATRDNPDTASEIDLYRRNKFTHF